MTDDGFARAQAAWDNMLPPEAPDCGCPEAEDDPEHDPQECLDAQAEDAAERRGEAQREEEMWDD